MTQFGKCQKFKLYEIIMIKQIKINKTVYNKIIKWKF